MKSHRLLGGLLSAALAVATVALVAFAPTPASAQFGPMSGTIARPAPDTSRASLGGSKRIETITINRWEVDGDGDIHVCHPGTATCYYFGRANATGYAHVCTGIGGSKAALVEHLRHTPREPVTLEFNDCADNMPNRAWHGQLCLGTSRGTQCGYVTELRQYRHNW